MSRWREVVVPFLLKAAAGRWRPVKVFVTSILRRLGVANRVQAAIVAYEAGLV